MVAVLDPGGGKASLSDAQREASLLIITAPDRQRVEGRDCCDQPLAQELAGHPVGGPAL
jgi:hypothetical protein